MINENEKWDILPDDTVGISNENKGIRNTEGKLRYDLVNPYAHQEMVKVLTFGASKYADRNWEKGMEWSEKIIAPMARHLAAIQAGEDYDIDKDCDDCQKSTDEKWVCEKHSGLLHSAHVACGAHFLTSAYKLFPQLDDRPHTYLKPVKIGLDIDEVLCDFVKGMMDRFPEMEDRSVFWNDHYIFNNFDEIKDDHDFWLNLPVKIKPKDLPFEPHCYITSRPIPSEITEQWLKANGFPKAKVYTVGNTSKVDVAKKSGIEIFVDDRYENFVELNKAGICCFLMDATHNSRYNVGFKRIKNLKQIL